MILTECTSETTSSFVPAMHHPHSVMQFRYPLPYGAIMHDDGVQFSVYSKSATAMRVLLYDDVSDREPSDVIRFDPNNDRWGDIWSVFVPEPSSRSALPLPGGRVPTILQRGQLFDAPRAADRSLTPERLGRHDSNRLKRR